MTYIEPKYCPYCTSENISNRELEDYCRTIAWQCHDCKIEFIIEGAVQR